jgi:hypothetical protein
MNGIHLVLGYADNVSLIGDDIRTIERNANVLLNDCRDIGLALNRKETKIMEVGCHRGTVANEHTTVGCNSNEKGKSLDI